MIQKYNREFDTNSHLDVELVAFRMGLTVAQGGLGRHKHFENYVREVWPEFVWMDEAYEQADALCNYPVSGFTSGASFMKSDLMSKYANACWQSNPVETLVIVCSTSALDAKQRIFGHVIRDFRKARAQNKAVGKLIESQSIIKLSESTDGTAASDNSSICLVAAGDHYKDDALKRLEGRKNKWVVLLIDEGQDVSQTIIDAALWNLSANTRFEVHMAGNAASRFDSLGIFMAPIEGWPSVNRYTHKWNIRVGGREGIGIHFDATSDNAPNMKRFSLGVPQLPFMRKAEDILAARTHLGEHNPVYMRQFVGFWPDNESETNFLVTDQSLASHEAYDKVEWKSAPVGIGGIDPSYSSEGDRFIFHYGKWGLSSHGIWTLSYEEAIQVKPIAIPGETKDDANIRECKRIADERDISPRNIGMDASAGTPLLSIAHRTWSADILGVPFGGSATDLAISHFDKRLASEVYANAVSELWGVFVEFLNASQIRGVKPDHAKELTARKFEFAAGGKVKVEKKGEMKKRLGFSPDIADSGMVVLRVLRERLKIQAGTSVQSAGQSPVDWKSLARKFDVVTQTHRERSGERRALPYVPLLGDGAPGSAWDRKKRSLLDRYF